MNSAIAPSIISPAQQAISRYIDGIEDRNKKGLNLKVGHKRYMDSVTLCGPLLHEDLLYSPKVSQILIELLGEDLVLNNYTVVISLPGAKSQHIHSDGGSLFEPSCDIHLPPYAVTVAIPLVDIDLVCGPTAIWAGSHLKDGSAVRDSKGNVFPPRVPTPCLGDVSMFDYRTKPAGMANNANFARPILYIVFSRPWWIDSSNFSAQQRPVRITSKNLRGGPHTLRG